MWRKHVAAAAAAAGLAGLLPTSIATATATGDALPLPLPLPLADHEAGHLHLLQTARSAKTVDMDRVQLDRACTAKGLALADKGKDLPVDVLDCEASVDALQETKSRPSYVINALGERFGFCDLTDVDTHYDVPEQHQESCAVYCAFKECHAAENFISMNLDAMKESCGTVSIYIEGARCFVDQGLAVRDPERCRDYVVADLKAVHEHGGSGGSGESI